MSNVFHKRTESRHRQSVTFLLSEGDGFPRPRAYSLRPEDGENARYLTMLTIIEGRDVHVSEASILMSNMPSTIKTRVADRASLKNDQ